MLGAYAPLLYSATNLPLGLSFNTSTGIIDGKVSTVGIYNATIGASNITGSDSKTLVINVLEPAPIVNFTNSSKPTAKYLIGDSISFSVSATNNPTSYTIGSLPTFLSYNNTNKNFTGTAPTITKSNTYFVSVSATNGTGTGINSYAFYVLVPPTITNLPTTVGGTASTTITFTCNTTNMDTIDGIKRYTYTAISAPVGVSMRSDSTGNSWWDCMAINASGIQGKVDLFNTIKGNYILDITATNDSGTSTVKRLTFTFV
jgi:hypothetical protein